MAYLPMGVAHAGLSGSDLWRISSGAFLCFMLAGGVSMIHRMRTLPDDVRAVMSPVVRLTSVVTWIIAMFALLLNLSGLGLKPQFFPYFLALVVLLLNGSIQFTRILFIRPE